MSSFHVYKFIDDVLTDPRTNTSRQFNGYFLNTSWPKSTYIHKYIFMGRCFVDRVFTGNIGISRVYKTHHSFPGDTVIN